MEISSRRIVSLEKDIRHAYAQMKSLLQAEEKVQILQMIFLIDRLLKILGASNRRKISQSDR